jgi:TolB-like protein/Flp pilus assembly protein TadD
MPQTAEVFISYARSDKERVLALAGQLREAGVALWIDQSGIDGAAMWSEEIVNALENAKVLMLMVTENSVGSHNVVKEVVLASERKSHILPVHLEATRIPQGLKYPLAGIQHIEYFANDPSEGLKSIIRSLERLGVTLKKEVQPVAAGATASTAGHSMHSGTGATQDVPEAGIAVLPFENTSPDPDADYFSDGLTDELIASLSKVGTLEVVSRLTSVQYKNTRKDAQTIGQELQARYIVTGTVRKFQENLRITAQMVDAKTNKQLWAETYKGKLADIFDIQESVSKEIAEALKLKLTINEQVVLGKRPTLDVEAFDLYLRGKTYLYRFTKSNIEFAIQVFEKAIKLDQRYAAAYAACAEAYGQLSLLYGKKEDLYEKSLELSLKALMYDNSLPEAYAALGLAYFCKKSFDDALAACQRAIELDPENFLAYWILGRIYISTDRFTDAIPLLKRVRTLKPELYSALTDLHACYESLGMHAEADATTQTLLDFFPGYLWDHPDDARAHICFATRLAKVNRNEEARVECRKAEELSSNDTLMLYNVACFYALLNEKTEAIQTLKRCVESGYQFYDWLKRDPDFDNLRNDPDFIALMEGK